MEKSMKFEDYDKVMLRSRLNLYYSLSHGTGITAAILGLAGLALVEQPKFSLCFAAVSAPFLIVSVIFQKHYIAYRDELCRRKL